MHRIYDCTGSMLPLVCVSFNPSGLTVHMYALVLVCAGLVAFMLSAACLNQLKYFPDVNWSSNSTLSQTATVQSCEYPCGQFWLIISTREEVLSTISTYNQLRVLVYFEVTSQRELTLVAQFLREEFSASMSDFIGNISAIITDSKFRGCSCFLHLAGVEECALSIFGKIFRHNSYT